MKKRIMFFLCALLTLLPLGASAENLPEVLSAVSQGLSEGLSEGLKESAEQIAAHTPTLSAEDFSLALSTADTRLEEGRTMTLTLAAENPYPQPADVTFTLALPDRLSCAQPLTFSARLEGAKADPVTGELMPSTAAFTREVTLIPGSGESEQVTLMAEMSMGARFYRATAALDLCVPRISAASALDGGDDGRIQPGAPFSLLIDMTNDGAAPKDVAISYLLPSGVSPSKELPEGFAFRKRTIEGAVRAEAGSSISVSLPLLVDEDALSGDADASRMISGLLTVDGKRLDAPMLHIVGPMISAKLMPEMTSLEEGRTMDLAITVVNTGLAAADVELSCLLPQGLSVVEEAPSKADEAAQQEDVIPRPEKRKEDGALVYAIHMDAATQTESGVAAAAKELILRVRADMPLEDTADRLLGASLAWRTDGGSMQLSQAAALRVHGQGFLGLDSGEWNGILLAGILMLITVCCLCSAVKSDKQEDYCFE